MNVFDWKFKINIVEHTSESHNDVLVHDLIRKEQILLNEEIENMNSR